MDDKEMQLHDGVPMMSRNLENSVSLVGKVASIQINQQYRLETLILGRIKEADEFLRQRTYASDKEDISSLPEGFDVSNQLLAGPMGIARMIQWKNGQWGTVRLNPIIERRSPILRAESGIAYTQREHFPSVVEAGAEKLPHAQ